MSDHVPETAPPVVLWDLDGTLVRLRITLGDVADWKRRLDGIFAPRGWAGGWSPLLPSLEAALTEAGADDEERARTYAELDAWEAASLAGVDVFDSVARVVASLARGGVRQALVTNNGPTACAAALDALSARATELSAELPEFGAIVTRGSTVRAKPSPEMFERAIRDMQGQLGPVVVIGDSPGDADAARALAANGDVRVVFVRADGGTLIAADEDQGVLRDWGLGAIVSD